MNNGTVTPRMVAAWAETLAETTESDTATVAIYLGLSGNLHWTDAHAVFTPPPEGVESLRFDVAERTFVAFHVTYGGTLQRSALDAALGAPARVTGARIDYDVAKNGGVAQVTATFDGDAPTSRLLATTLRRAHVQKSR